MQDKPIANYMINLKTRAERKKHIIKEFAGRDEFKTTIVEDCEHENVAIGPGIVSSNYFRVRD